MAIDKLFRELLRAQPNWTDRTGETKSTGLEMVLGIIQDAIRRPMANRMKKAGNAVAKRASTEACMSSQVWPSHER